MLTVLSRFPLTGSAVIFSLVGCGDPEREDLGEPGDPVVMDEIEGCMGTPYQVSFEQVVPGGASAAAVVAEFEGSYASELLWVPSSGAVDYDLPSEPGGIEVAFEFSQTPAEVRWVESLVCDGTVSCQANCMTRLEIPAVLRVSSADGTLDEELSVVVAATKRGIHVVQQVLLEELQGSIAEDTFTIDADWTLLQYQIQTEVDDEGELRGRFLLALVDPEDLLWFNTVGVWPPPQ
jgi:hypothetical protein